jgi:hypothetical protein
VAAVAASPKEQVDLTEGQLVPLSMALVAAVAAVVPPPGEHLRPEALAAHPLSRTTPLVAVGPGGLTPLRLVLLGLPGTESSSVGPVAVAVVPLVILLEPAVELEVGPEAVVVVVVQEAVVVVLLGPVRTDRTGHAL